MNAKPKTPNRLDRFTLCLVYVLSKLDHLCLELFTGLWSFLTGVAFLTGVSSLDATPSYAMHIRITQAIYPYSDLFWGGWAFMVGVFQIYCSGLAIRTIVVNQKKTHSGGVVYTFELGVSGVTRLRMFSAFANCVFFFVSSVLFAVASTHSTAWVAYALLAVSGIYVLVRLAFLRHLYDRPRHYN